VRGGVLRMTRWVLYGCHSEDVEGLGKRRVEKRDHSKTRPRMVGSGCGCIPLAMARGAGCRGEERMASGLKEGGWKRENEGKCEWWSKGIESKRYGEGMRGAYKVARAQEGAFPGANSGAGAKCASQGQEMVFDEEDGVVGRVRGFAQADHLHRGEPRWTLDGTPLRERETVCDRNGNNIRCTTRHCDPSHTAVTNNLLLETLSSPSPSKQVGRTQVPSFKIMLSSLFDGLEVLDPLQSCNNRRANRHRDAFTRLRHRCHSMNCPAVEEHTHTCVLR
jgi:hypothetical protein